MDELSVCKPPFRFPIPNDVTVFKMLSIQTKQSEVSTARAIDNEESSLTLHQAELLAALSRHGSALRSQAPLSFSQSKRRDRCRDLIR